MQNFTILAVLSSFVFFVSPAFAVIEISDGSIKSLYHFEDLVDSSGNGYNFSQSGGEFIQGKLNDGYNSNITGDLNATSSAWDMSNDYSIGFWIKFAGDPTGGWLGRKISGGGTTPDGFAYATLCTSAGYTEFTHDAVGASCQVNYSQNYSSDTWYYIFVNRHGTIVDFYINDVLKASVTEDKTNNEATTVDVNGPGDTTETGFMIDELFFRTAATVTSTRIDLYNSGSGSEICVSAGCGTSSSTPSSTPSSTAMTSFEKFLSYEIILIIVLLSGIGTYKLLT